jgi:hypothetical protein
MAGEVIYPEQDDEHCGGREHAATKPDLLESGNPAASCLQVAVSGTGPVGMPSHEATRDQEDKRKYGSG